MPQSKLITWKRVLSLLLVVVGLYAVHAGYSIYRMVAVRIPHSYAAWATGDLLVEYMETHEGSWPRGWEDLKKAEESLVKKGRNIYYDFDKLPAMVKIDWSAEPSILAKEALADGASSLKAVTRLDGSRLEAVWGPATEPNRKVAFHLIQRYGPTNAMGLPETASSTNVVRP